MKERIIYLVIAILIIFTGCTNEGNLSSNEIQISEDEYHQFDVYGINSSANESEIFTRLIESINIEEFEEFANQENRLYFRCHTGESINWIEEALIGNSEVAVVVYALEESTGIISISIDYVLNDDRVILEYFESGLVRKTINENGDIQIVTNDLKYVSLISQ